MKQSGIEPVVKTITMALGQKRAFDLFTKGIGTWWPLESHSVGGEHASRCAFECEDGGSIYEVDDNDSRHEWGRVVVFDSPERVVFTWYPGREPSEVQRVEVVFSAAGSGCRVTLTHTGWEEFGDRAVEMRDGYDSGWDLVFVRRFGGAAG